MNFKYVFTENTWVVLSIAIIISFVFPIPGLIIKPYLSYLLIILMFLSCLKVNFHNILENLRDYKKYIYILGIIHLCSPLIILLTKPFFSDEIFLGLIIASVIPSAMSVVFLTQLYGGTASKSLVVTTLSNVLSPLIVPFLILMFASVSIKLDLLSMSLNMILLVIFPFVFAMIIKRTKLSKPLIDHSIYTSIIILFLLILGIVSPLRDTVLSNPNEFLLLGGFITLLIVINFILGYLIGKDKEERISYGISSSYKNFTLSSVIALSFSSIFVALPAIIYAIVSNLLLIPLQLFIKKRN